MLINTPWLLKHRKLVLISITLFSLCVSLFIFRLKTDSSITLALPKNDPVYLSNQAAENMFGGSDQLVILIKYQDGDSLQPKKNLLDGSGIRVVIGISEILKGYEQLDSDQILSVPELMFRFWRSQKDKPSISKEKFFDQLISNHLSDQLHAFSEQSSVRGRYISLDKSTTLVTAPIPQRLANSDQPLKEFISALKKDVSKLNERFPNVEILLSGQPVVKANLMRYMAKDLYQLFPLAIFVVMLILYITLASVRLMWVPMLVTFFSIAWTFSLKGALNSPLTIIETVIPIILISIACADGIHILLGVIYELGEGHHLKTAIVRAMNSLKSPIILTTVTTACGFISLMTGAGVSIKNMGFYLSIGVFVALFFSFAFLPPLLSFFPEEVLLRAKRRIQKRSHHRDFFRWLPSFYKFLYRIRWMGVICLVILAYFSVIALSNIKTDTDEVRYFKPTNPVRQVAEEVEKNLGGFNTLYLVLRPISTEGVLNEVFLDECRGIKQKLENLNEVSYHFSFLDWYDSFWEQQEASFESNTAAMKAVKENLKEIITSSLSDPQLSKTVNEDLTYFNFVIKMKESSTVHLQKVIDTLSPNLKKQSDVFEFHFAGDAIRLHSGRVIVQNQMSSLLLSVVFILLLSSLFFKSLFTGFFVTLPTTIAILLNFIVMWFFDVSLNPATAIIASVSLGVGVDYAIHFISRFQLELKRSEGNDSIINLISCSAKHTMIPILTNALAVGVGFLVLLFSSYQIIVDMGWVIALSMLTTALSSLVVLPMFLSMYYHFKGKRILPTN